MFILIGSLVAAVVWAAHKAPPAAPAKVDSLPPPDPVPYTAGRALLSPAMGVGSSQYAGSNWLRLQTRMVNPETGGNVSYLQRTAVTGAAPLPTALGGSMAPPMGPLPTVQQGDASNLLAVNLYRKV